MYVDDIMGVCLRKDLTHDMKTARSICADLLGPDAIADDKSKSGRCLDLIGHVIDLHTKSLLIAKKNFLFTGFTQWIQKQKLLFHSLKSLHRGRQDIL